MTGLMGQVNGRDGLMRWKITEWIIMWNVFMTWICCGMVYWWKYVSDKEWRSGGCSEDNRAAIGKSTQTVGQQANRVCGYDFVWRDTGILWYWGCNGYGDVCNDCARESEEGGDRSTVEMMARNFEVWKLRGSRKFVWLLIAFREYYGTINISIYLEVMVWIMS